MKVAVVHTLNQSVLIVEDMNNYFQYSFAW